MFQHGLEDVLNKIDREELVRLTRELVRIPSVYRPDEADGDENDVVRFVADHLRNAGFEVRTEEVVPSRSNVWAVWEGDWPGKTLLFVTGGFMLVDGGWTAADGRFTPPL